MAFKTFAVLTVKNPTRPDREDLRLTFIDPDAAYEAYRQLDKLGYNADLSQGLRLFRKTSDAVNCAVDFLGKVN